MSFAIETYKLPEAGRDGNDLSRAAACAEKATTALEAALVARTPAAKTVLMHFAQMHLRHAAGYAERNT